MELMKEQDGESLDIVGENLEALKTIFPEAFTEDGVNFDTLRQLLGDEVDDGEEKYGLNWHGKKKARQIALTPSMGTLRPCPEESVDWETTQNLFIEGDNLEVLKLLQKSYAGKVKMIYIDPPYNTGKEFIYPDRFQDNLDTYLKYTSQKDDEGMKFSSNTEQSGRYHTNWLNMMYPRLKLARNLLCDDGVIFISIDDHEQANLKEVFNQVFGEENFVAHIIWQHSVQPKGYSQIFSIHHNHIYCYRKSEAYTVRPLERTEKDNINYSNPDNDPRGDWRTGDVRNALYRPNLIYPLESPSGKIIEPPENGWRWSRKTMDEKIESGEIIFSRDETRIIRKIYLANLDGRAPETIWFSEDVGNTRQGSQELKELFDGKVPFDTVKPTKIIRRMLQISGVGSHDICLDFFAGSCSTAHALFDEPNSGRFIVVQLPEIIDTSTPHGKTARDLGFSTIADVGKERIRRAASKIKKETPLYDGDLGFKVFKLDSSNIRAWNPDKGDMEKTLLDHTEHLVEGRSEEDVLYELLLKRGVDLTVPIEEREIEGKAVYSIGYGVLFACLDTAISRDEVEEIAQGIVAWHQELEPASDTQVVFRDSAFADDIAKTNMTAILEQNGIAHVRSL